MSRGEVVFNVDESHSTIWATQEQMAQLFDVQVPAIARHLSNIYKSGELQLDATFSKMEKVQLEGSRKVKRHIKLYNLDAIISVGYRVNSKKATDFRIWATKVLRRYVLDGVAVNRPRLKELDVKKLRELEGALSIVKRLVAASELSAGEAGGILEVITKYAPSFRALPKVTSPSPRVRREPPKPSLSPSVILLYHNSRQMSREASSLVSLAVVLLTLVSMPCCRPLMAKMFTQVFPKKPPTSCISLSKITPFTMATNASVRCFLLCFLLSTIVTLPLVAKPRLATAPLPP